MLIGIFFLMSIQLVFMGIIGEYVGAIYTKVQQRPYAIERSASTSSTRPPPSSPP